MSNRPSLAMLCFVIFLSLLLSLAIIFSLGDQPYKTAGNTNALFFGKLRPRSTKLDPTISEIQIKTALFASLDTALLSKYLLAGFDGQYQPNFALGNKLEVRVEIVDNFEEELRVAELVGDDSSAVVAFSTIKPNFNPFDPHFLVADPITGHSIGIQIRAKKINELEVSKLIISTTKAYLPQYFDRSFYFPRWYDRDEPLLNHAPLFNVHNKSHQKTRHFTVSGLLFPGFNILA